MCERRPGEIVLRHAAWTITWYSTTGRFVAHCLCEGHGRRCFREGKGRPLPGLEDKQQKKKGRPLGMLMAWLMAPIHGTGPQNADVSTQHAHKVFQPDLALRKRWRASLEAMQEAAPLFLEERVQRDDEDKEPAEL